MAFIPYIHFDGTCAEAMSFYARVFGSEPPVVMRYSEAPEGAATASTRVMHSELKLGSAKLMASDYAEPTPERQSGMSVMHHVRDAEEGSRLYSALAEGGTELVAFGPSFWSLGFGMVRDRFGTHWIIAAPVS